jgi:hypothetical protein
VGPLGRANLNLIVFAEEALISIYIRITVTSELEEMLVHRTYPKASR